MKKYLKFFIGKVFLINLLVLIVVWIAIVWIEMAYLDSFTRHGQKIEVPNFYGVHKDALDDLVAGKNIQYEIVDSVYTTDFPPGVVIFQYPEPTDSTDVYMKEGRIIKLRLSKRTKLVVMPRLNGKVSKRIAESLLESKGLTYTIDYKLDPSVSGEGQVLQQLYKGEPIDSGVLIPIGSKIQLIVSKGLGGEEVNLPDFTGMTFSKVKQLSGSFSVKVMECSNCITEEDKANARVVKQLPLGGDGMTILSGTTLEVWLEK
ncbi:MAG: PASTA domain-containing protein [Crocinitomicaceae bacterium]|nr:PASTA domain-containing protein [Crocinitomicaceae bacterium]